MNRGWKIALSVLGGLWAFFLVAITMTPHDLWQHVVEWWGVILTGLGFAGSALFWLFTHMGMVGLIRTIFLGGRQNGHRHRRRRW